jgi:hypothetical protein
MTYPTDLNSPLVPFIIFNFHGLKNPCNSEAVNVLNRSKHILRDTKICLKESKIQTRGNFEIYVVQVLLSGHNEPCACVLSVRPSRDSVVNINITVIKIIYTHEPQHEHLTVGIRHIVVPFTVLWPTLSA